MASLISAIRINASRTPAKSALIFVHGLGDSGEGWSWLHPLVQQKGIIKDADSINYIFPNAPSIPITVNGGYVMPSWFDIYEFGNPNAKQDEVGFLKSCDVLKALIEEQIDVHKIPAERIIIGGFSQGAAISLSTIALLDFKIGGVVALSGFCPIKSSIEKLHDGKDANYNTPIFQGHGVIDPLIPCSMGKETSEFFKSLGYHKLEFKTYDYVAHSTGEQELIDFMTFVGTILN
ncbi:hypothetical protein G9P44_002642 [Scheffersomyces stipitis]|nr:hypothetical protein G9P44_002642 [Scheffersomyces stipitis]